MTSSSKSLAVRLTVESAALDSHTSVAEFDSGVGLKFASSHLQVLLYLFSGQL
jgi:hypothetical protein